MWINEGGFPNEKDFKNGTQLLHVEARGFIICSSCGKILNSQVSEKATAKGRKKLQSAENSNSDPYKHTSKCEKRGQPGQTIALFTESKVEILRLLVPIPDDMTEDETKEWALSLGYALRSGMRHRYSLDGSEIEFIMEGPWTQTHNGTPYKLISLTFIDQNIGGSGYLYKIAEEFTDVAKDAIAYLDHKDCETACYRCLKSYNNQRFHQFLNWPRIISDLAFVSENTIKGKRLKLGDINDPTPWLEAYKEGVGSPLELKFLKLFEQNKIKVQKQVPVPADFPISTADFAIIDGSKQIAIYIDGAAFHVGKNLRRDIIIRNKLKNAQKPWTVIELRAKDLGKFTEIIEQYKLR